MAKRYLREEWTAFIVGRMHLLGVSRAELARRCGYSVPYISTVLNCKKKFESEAAYRKTRNYILKTMEKIEKEIMEGRYGN